jgi:hypothetical protein
LISRETIDTRGALLGTTGVGRFRKKIAPTVAVLTALLVSMVPMVGYSLPGLGISISFVNDGPTDAERAGSLWVGVEQGESVTRTMNIKSLSDDTTQSLEFELFDIVRVDGRKETDYTKPSKLTPWLVVSPVAPEVAPGETISVTLTFSAPEDSRDEAFDAVLRILASGVDGDDVDAEGGTKAIVKTKLAIEANLWLGVGDALTLEPNFEIDSVDGALIDEQKYIRIFFRNNGIVSIEPEGRFQLSDPAFVDRIFEPIDFEAEEILAGQLGFVDVLISDDVIDGVYRSFVTAQSGSVRKTQLFEGEIVFDDPNALAIPELALRIGVFVIATLGLVFGVRMLRSSSKTPGTKTPKAPRAAKLSKLSRTEPKQTALPESKDPLELLRQMMERLESQQGEGRKQTESVPVKQPERTVRSKAPAQGTPTPTKAKAQSATSTKAAAARKPVGQETADLTKPATKPRKPAVRKD